MLCINDGGYHASLIVGKVYRRSADAEAESLNLVRILDEDASEPEGYLYPASFFVPPRSAYTAQVPLLFSESIRDNILMGLPEDKVDLAAAIRLAVLEADLGEMPQGLDTMLGAKGVRISGGQRQRTAAARMFVRGPELLVFDDLSSALDVETEQLLWERLLARRTATCLAVSHRHAALRRLRRDRPSPRPLRRPIERGAGQVG